MLIGVLNGCVRIWRNLVVELVKKTNGRFRVYFFCPLGFVKMALTEKKYFLLQKVVPQGLILELQLFSCGENFSFFSENNYSRR